MVVKSKGIPAKCPKHSGLGIIVICPDTIILLMNQIHLIEPYQTLWHRGLQACLQFSRLAIISGSFMNQRKWETVTYWVCCFPLFASFRVIWLQCALAACWFSGKKVEGGGVKRPHPVPSGKPVHDGPAAQWWTWFQSKLLLVPKKLCQTQTGKLDETCWKWRSQQTHVLQVDTSY